MGLSGANWPQPRRATRNWKERRDVMVTALKVSWRLTARENIMAVHNNILYTFDAGYKSKANVKNKRPKIKDVLRYCSTFTSHYFPFSLFNLGPVPLVG